MGALRSTKIIATLGPASREPSMIRTLAESGVNVFRLNMSHGSHADHAQTHASIREVEAQLKRPIGILIDLQGPKLRLGQFADGPVSLEVGDRIQFDQDPTPGDRTRICLPHPEIIEALQVGDNLLIDDGKMSFTVIERGQGQLVAQADTRGKLSDRKGVNVPLRPLALSALSTKDKRDLEFGLSLGVDWVALSFVQRAEDVHEARALIGTQANIMAKIEKPAALTDIDAIVAAADGIMVARGDLGVELPPEEVPGWQKRLVRIARDAGRPVVVATQMLESMISAPCPTRAEASDVATAVYDGADAVMLSAETASGQFPVEAVKMMSRIICKTEGDVMREPLMHAISSRDKAPDAEDAIGSAIRRMSEVLSLSATVTFTVSGRTPLRMAHQRPHTPILCVTPSENVARRLTVVWGVHPHIDQTSDIADHMVETATDLARSEHLAEVGRPLVLVSGTPFGKPGTTNQLRVVWP